MTYCVGLSHFLGPPSCFFSQPWRFHPPSPRRSLRRRVRPPIIASPSLSSWTCLCWHCVSDSSGHHVVVAVTTRAADAMWGSISLVVGKREKRAMANVIAHFFDALDRPPISWVPPCVSPPQFRGRASICPPTSLWRGEGWVWLSSGLRIPRCGWWSPHPSREGRGSWSGGCGWLRTSCGGEGGGEGGGGAPLDGPLIYQYPGLA